MALPGLMASVVALLHSRDWHVRKEAVWVVGTVARAGTAQHGEALLELGVVGPLVKSLHDSRGAGAGAGMVEAGVDAVEAVLGLRRHQDAAPLLNAERLAGMFEEAGLVEELHCLPEYAASNVVAKGDQILMLYYPQEVEEEGVSTEEAV